MPKAPNRALHEILPRLWIRGRTNSLTLARKTALADQHGVRVVVGCCAQPDWEWADVPGVAYHHWPMSDGAALPDGLRQKARLLADAIESGSGVLVYCYSGKNRSGLLAGMTAHALLGASGDFIVALVRSGRPGSLTNQTFAAHLASLPEADFAAAP